MDDETMDNQQRKMEARLNWLGGIIDGEGMITLEKRKLNKRKQNCYQPRITVINTDMKIINEVLEILENLKIPHYIRSFKDKKHPHWKIKHEVVIAGIKRCNVTLPKIIPYLVGKRDKAENLLKFCRLRLSKPQNSLYGKPEETLLNLVRENKISFPYRSETTREALVIS